MRLEFFADRQTFILVLVALVTLAMLATGFVYPRPFSRRLSALRLAILVCFFAGAVSLTLVYPAPFARSSTLFVLVDRSLSMDQKLAPDGKTRGQLLDDIQAKLEAACESAAIQMKSVYFAEEASDQSARIGDRRTTRFSPALSLLLEKISAADGNPARTRALLISDGAAADEPMIDPYLSAFVGRGVSIDVWSVGGTSEASLPKIYFRIPPPPVATVGESVPLDLGVMSPASARLTVSDGVRVVSEAKWSGQADPPQLFFSPHMPGLRRMTVTAESASGSSKLNFRIKVLPRLLFEMSGRPSWDARYFMVAASEQPAIQIQGRWSAAQPSAPASGRIHVVFGAASRPTPADEPVVYWPQSDMTGTDRGIRWLGREAGSFSTARPAESPAPQVPASPTPAGHPPLTGRQKVSLDLSWRVLERYGDGTVFLAERTDSLAAPAFLVNGEGVWRWWVNPLLSPAKSPAAEYERFLDRVLSWARQTSFPPAELFALQEEGQIGAPMDLIALFSTPQSSVPGLKIISPDQSEQIIYGTGGTTVRFSFVPKTPGAWRAELSGASRQPVQTEFVISDAPFDLTHPEPRPDLLRHIAARTGGRLLAQDEAASGIRQAVAHLMDAAHSPAERIEEKRIRLSHTPAFFLAVSLLFALLWTLESRWLR